jgi:predicted kinase
VQPNLEVVNQARVYVTQAAIIQESAVRVIQRRNKAAERKRSDTVVEKRIQQSEDIVIFHLKDAAVPKLDSLEWLVTLAPLWGANFQSSN